MEPARVGIILDSSVIIAAERRGHSVSQILEQVYGRQGEVEVGLSVVTVAELVHGAYRAKTPEQQVRRLAFIERLCLDVPVHPVTLAIARLAGRIEGQQEAKGIRISFEDLLIGATALHLSHSIATLNVRHFGQIPALPITQLCSCRERLLRRSRDRPLRGRRNQRRVLGKHSGGIARLRRFPLFHALAQNFVADLNFQNALADIEANHVAIAHGSDRAAQRGFRRDVAGHQSMGSAAETAVG